MTFLNVLVVKKSLSIGIVVSMMLHIVILAINGLMMNIYQNWRMRMNINQEKLFNIVGKKLNSKFTKKELIQKHLESLWYNSRPQLFYDINREEYNSIVKEN